MEPDILPLPLGVRSTALAPQKVGSSIVSGPGTWQGCRSWVTRLLFLKLTGTPPGTPPHARSQVAGWSLGLVTWEEGWG